MPNLGPHTPPPFPQQRNQNSCPQLLQRVAPNPWTARAQGNHDPRQGTLAAPHPPQRRLRKPEAATTTPGSRGMSQAAVICCSSCCWRVAITPMGINTAQAKARAACSQGGRWVGMGDGDGARYFVLSPPLSCVFGNCHRSSTCNAGPSQLTCTHHMASAAAGAPPVVSGYSSCKI